MGDPCLTGKKQTEKENKKFIIRIKFYKTLQKTSIRKIGDPMIQHKSL